MTAKLIKTLTKKDKAAQRTSSEQAVEVSYMTQMKFRDKLYRRLRTGKRCSRLNARTKKMENGNPLLVIDLTYIEELLESRRTWKTSSLYNKSNDFLIKRFYEWLSAAFKLITPAGLLFISEKESEFIKSLGHKVIYQNIKDALFTFMVQKKILPPVCILSNNLELWSLASPSANLSFLAIDSNNRLVFYNNKTGLDILSKFIGTYKIINKLKLDSLKFMSLQYLYLLLFYIQFTNRKSDDVFYFDKDYFKDKNFLYSNGLGLSLLYSAHKFLSYAFLTKNEFLDYFLLGEASHYSINLKRLQKLLDIDRQILEKMKSIYDKTQYPKLLLDLYIPDTQPTLSERFKYSEKITDNTTDDIKNFINNLLGT